MSTSDEEPRIVAGRYRLRSVLGSGAMGTVWAAYDEFLQRMVAVKEVRLPPGVAASQADELRERTLREARAIAVLSHPNVIILHDVAREDGDPFVVMELLPSHSLAELLRDHGPLDVEQAAAMADAVAAALEAAHAAGITHRDVKPGNVLISSDGRIKLTDFGIARNVSEATMTRTGMMLGSPAYIAPEVASGRGVTPSADLWGLGATLFAAVEGAPPYDADGDPLETVGKVVHGEVPKPAPGPLSQIIEGLMAKEPRDRISLAEARRRLYPLYTKAAHALFPPELFASPAGHKSGDRPDVTDTQVIPAPKAPSPAAAGDAEKSTELAADPGPLPFMTADRPTVVPQPIQQAQPRRPLVSVALTVTAIVLFLAATAGGFVAARTIGGESITPPPKVDTTLPVSAPPPQLELRKGETTTLKGQKGSGFTVALPREWVQFTTQQEGEGLPPSSLIQFVSPRGDQVFSAERFPDYFPKGTVEKYLNTLRSKEEFVLPTEPEPLSGQDGLAFTYRTVERGNPSARGSKPTGQASIGRTTFAQAYRHGTSLWVVSVTVPTTQESPDGADLSTRILPSFTISN
ncbi:serine/threonine-protein kinase [Amycolatopsis sp. CA-230715]|uniref:serine/threonine-protein kinase n=1 Tax=Amycolatopsis sp. CA-230715 TaxID=2745196 RepID=UPI001C022872|nr:serine/threonine-protein kinase [Amycolatopsis sp. CA-230715]